MTNLTDGAWATSMKGDDLLRYALAAVLRTLPVPWFAEDVERAVITTVWPVFLVRMGAMTHVELCRLMGTNDPDSRDEFVGGWAHQVRLAFSHQLLSINADGRWQAGADIDDASDVPLNARASFVVEFMERTAIKEDQ